eukprot:579086-Pleurochrysis_carterae.AAC.2
MLYGGDSIINPECAYLAKFRHPHPNGGCTILANYLPKFIVPLPICILPSGERLDQLSNFNLTYDIYIYLNYLHLLNDHLSSLPISTTTFFTALFYWVSDRRHCT